MTVVGEAAVRLVLDTKAFQSQLAAMSAQINTLGKNFNTLGSSSGGINNVANSVGKVGAEARNSAADIRRLKDGIDRFAKGVTVAGLGIVGLGAGIAAFAGKAAADLELVTLGFQGLLQSTAEGAKAFTDALVEFAARTPFEIGEVTKATQRLLGAGFDPEQITPMLTKIGDFAALIGSTGSEVNGFVRALAQIEGKGRFTADNVRQLTENLPGLNAMELIAGELGITTQEAFAQMEDGALSADVGINALLTGMQKFPGAAGAMDRASRTLVGEVSNLKDGFKLVSFQVAESSGLLDTLKTTIDGLGTSFSDSNGLARSGLTAALEGIAKFVAEVGPKLPSLIDSLGEGVGAFFESAGPGIVRLIDAINNNAGAALGGLGEGFGALASAASGFLNAVSPLLSVLDALGPGVAGVVAQFALLGKILPAAGIGAMSQQLQGLTTSLSGTQRALLGASGALAAFAGGNQAGQGNAGGLIGIAGGALALGTAMAPLGPYGFAVGAGLGAAAGAAGAIVGHFQAAAAETKQFATDVNNLAAQLLNAAGGSPYLIDVVLKTNQDDFSVAGLEALIGPGSVTEFLQAGVDLPLVFKASMGDNDALDKILKDLGATWNENIDEWVLPFDKRSLESDLNDVLAANKLANEAAIKARRDAEVELGKVSSNEGPDSFERRMQDSYNRTVETTEAMHLLVDTTTEWGQAVADIDFSGLSEDNLKQAQKMLDEIYDNAVGIAMNAGSSFFVSMSDAIRQLDADKKPITIDAVLNLQAGGVGRSAWTADLLAGIASDSPAFAAALTQGLADGANIDPLLAEWYKMTPEQQRAHEEQAQFIADAQSNALKNEWTEIGSILAEQLSAALIGAFNMFLVSIGETPIMLPIEFDTSSWSSPYVNPNLVPDPVDVPIDGDFSQLPVSIREFKPEPVVVPLDADARSLINGIAAIPTQTVDVYLRPIRGAFALGGLAYNGIPMFKDGGITGSIASAAAGYANVASRATAIYGEAGKEAYVPMRANPTSRDVDIANRLVDHFASKGIELGGSSKVINFTQNVNGNSGSPDRVAQRFLSIWRNLG